MSFVSLLVRRALRVANTCFIELAPPWLAPHLTKLSQQFSNYFFLRLFGFMALGQSKGSWDFRIILSLQKKRL